MSIIFVVFRHNSDNAQNWSNCCDTRFHIYLMFRYPKIQDLDLYYPSPIFLFLQSQPVQEPEKMTQIIVEALERTGQRGIINKGWGGLGNCKFCLLF